MGIEKSNMQIMKQLKNLNEIISELSAANIAAFSDVNALSNDQLPMQRPATSTDLNTRKVHRIEEAFIDPNMKQFGTLMSPASEQTEADNSDCGGMPTTTNSKNASNTHG